ncbi:acyltransferase [Saccharophagus sp. K07]|uniref:acyltransferase family protein n=1 Tax=Saccharophagus sp. K07 TaxID=2283636 RepID=UPI00165215B5|nr:acyltransferase family protein [Saccharophagus sp. K07]MBC6904367.1 acyltransferase [Saccharophagus sp. K07]
MQYRKEIDGLRALAVLPVILFHAGFELFGGGFVGVDIFFVISGYLITTIIIDDIEKKRFSIAKFYERRVRRILPALFLMLGVVYIASWFLYLPAAHKVAGQYVISSIFSFSNILLYLKGKDYFGLEHSNNPLFHTWSLGVEEQFYFVIPVVLYFFWRSNRIWQLSLVVAVIALSLLVNYIKREDASFNFYMVFSRAWELGAGMLAAVLKRQGVRPNQPLSVVGLLLVLISVVAISSTHPYLNFILVFPVLGAFLLIVFTTEHDHVGRILSLKPVLLIGLISYSLYLWHVPLLIFGTYLFDKGVVQLAVYFLALFCISYWSYKYVETPFRKTLPLKPVLATVGVLTLCLSTMGVIGHVNGGYPSRSELLSHLENNNGWGLRCNGNVQIDKKCSVSETPAVAVLGNSYSMVFVNALRHDYSADLVQLTQDSCAVGYIDNVADVNSLSCEDFYRRAVSTIKSSESIQTVIISSPFNRELSNDEYKASFLRLLNDLKQKNVYVIGPTPSAPFKVGECLFKAQILGHAQGCDFEVDNKHYEKVQRIADFVNGIAHVRFIDITEIICPAGKCAMKIGDSDSMYIDTGHLSKMGAKVVTAKIASLMGFRSDNSAEISLSTDSVISESL